jgi:hypothetical protein
MNDVLHPFIDSFLILYLDDILIFNRAHFTCDERTRNIKEESTNCKFEEL